MSDCRQTRRGRRGFAPSQIAQFLGIFRGSFFGWLGFLDCHPQQEIAKAIKLNPRSLEQSGFDFPVISIDNLDEVPVWVVEEEAFERSRPQRRLDRDTVITG